MAGDCGTCTMCCRVMAVTELKKPKNTQCEHCSIGVGCRIYHDRPDNCRSFRCIWLQTQALANAMPLNQRPDKCKVLLHTTPDEKSIVAKCDPNYPDAWRWKGIGLLLGQLSQRLFVLVDNGKQYWLLRDNNAQQVHMSVADEDGNEHLQGYVK